MASRVSSDGRVLARLPVVGTSWYRRGLPYWLRRVLYPGFVALALLVIGICLVFAFYDVFSGVPDGWRTVCYVVHDAACVVCLGWGWVRGRRQVKQDRLDPSSVAERGATFRLRQRSIRPTTAWTALVRLLSVLLLPFLAALMAYALGGYVAVNLVRELPSEAAARRELGEPGTAW
ncbi:hypothetical protein [Streptomyces sp. DW26H14]|uniref:hypothetical protein n=1 Tax=Streptomyces sp. DW26H14 TaxID=3435395 RepID=UPI00403DAAED